MVKAARLLVCVIGGMAVCARAVHGDERGRGGPTPEELIRFLAASQHRQTGLLESYPGSADRLLDDVAFTYDVAVSALAFAHRGRLTASAKALESYQRMPLPTANPRSFNTAYHVRTARPTLEYRLHGGPLFWTAIALLRYGQAASRPDAIERGIQLLEWAKDHLDHFSGGVVMGIEAPWSYITSVENNWVYYAALRVAIAALPDGPRRQALEEEKRRVREWLGRHARDRGDGDPVKALDVYTHALLVGPDAHLEDDRARDRRQLAQWAKGWIEELDALFLVPGTTRYDYTDAREAKQAGRERMGWLEGTEQVAVACLTWAPFFQELGDEAFARRLVLRAGLAHADVMAFAIRHGGGRAIPNTDAGRPLQTFSDGWVARPRWEPALNGTNWAYLASVGYNPFTTPVPSAREPGTRITIPRPALMPILTSLQQ